jgi:hypothetical protein
MVVANWALLPAYNCKLCRINTSTNTAARTSCNGTRGHRQRDAERDYQVGRRRDSEVQTRVQRINRFDGLYAAAIGVILL